MGVSNSSRHGRGWTSPISAYHVEVYKPEAIKGQSWVNRSFILHNAGTRDPSQQGLQAQRHRNPPLLVQ